MPAPNILPYYSNLIISRRASKLVFRIAGSEFCVCAPIYILLSALFGGLIGINSNFTGVEEAAVSWLLLSLPEIVHNCVQSVGFSGLYQIVLLIV